MTFLYRRPGREKWRHRQNSEPTRPFSAAEFDNLLILILTYEQHRVDISVAQRYAKYHNTRQMGPDDTNRPSNGAAHFSSPAD